MAYPLFDFWLERTKVVQEEEYGYDFEAMDLWERAAYLQKMTFAAMVELGECSRKFSWKPWAVDDPYIVRAELIEEYVDVLHFVADCLVALGVDGRELNEAYSRKLDENIQRARSGGYTAVRNETD